MQSGGYESRQDESDIDQQAAVARWCLLCVFVRLLTSLLTQTHLQTVQETPTPTVSHCLSNISTAGKLRSYGIWMVISYSEQQIHGSYRQHGAAGTESWFTPLIRLRRITICKFVFIDGLTDLLDKSATLLFLLATGGISKETSAIKCTRLVHFIADVSFEIVDYALILLPTTLVVLVEQSGVCVRLQ